MNRMSKFSIYTLLVVVWLSSISGFAQKEEENITLSKEQVAQLIKNEEVMNQWLEKLTTPGVEVKGNEMKFSLEVLKMMKNPKYRKSVFKANYSFVDVAESLSVMEIQKAFWQLLNLYPNNKEKVVKYIYAYESIIDSSRVLFSAFYTYAFFDPSISTIEDGNLNIIRPDLLENLHKDMLEIISYISFLEKNKKQ